MYMILIYSAEVVSLLKAVSQLNVKVAANVCGIIFRVVVRKSFNLSQKDMHLEE